MKKLRWIFFLDTWSGFFIDDVVMECFPYLPEIQKFLSKIFHPLVLWYAKALKSFFDKAHRNVLLLNRCHGHNICSLRCKNIIVKSSFLDTQQIFSKIEKQESRLATTRSSAGSGTVLEPVVFVAYLVGIPNEIRPKFAVDISSIGTGNTIKQVVEECHRSIYLLQERCSGNGMKLNEFNTKIINFSWRKRPHFSFP